MRERITGRREEKVKIKNRRKRKDESRKNQGGKEEEELEGRARRRGGGGGRVDAPRRSGTATTNSYTPRRFGCPSRIFTQAFPGLCWGGSGEHQARTPQRTRVADVGWRNGLSGSACILFRASPLSLNGVKCYDTLLL